MALENQRHRVVRRSWGTDADGLAQELSAILASDVEPTTGKIAINLRNSNAPTREFEFETQSTLALPVIDVDEPLAADTVREDAISGETSGAEKTITSNRTWHVRSTFMGQVVSFQSGDSTYTVNLYPNSPSASAAEVVQVTGVIPKHSGGGAGTEVPANHWIKVFRVTTCRATSLTFNTGAQTIGKSNEVTIDSQYHYFINQDFLHTDISMPGDLTIIDNNQLFFRDPQIYLQSGADGNLTIEADDGINISIGGTVQLRINNDNLIFNAGTTDPRFNFTTDGVLAMAEGKLHLTTSANPALEVDQGVQFDGTTTLNGAIDHNGTTVGFFSATPVTQRTNIGAITDNSTGSSGSSFEVASIAGVAQDTNLANNFATIANRLNALEQILQDLGLTN